MAMDWFRSWHNAPTDPKWLLIARKANVPPGMVSAVFWALLDYASQEKERGSIDGFDVETYAGWAGWEDDDVQAVLDAMRSKGVITPDDRLSSWEKRQVKREDESSTERVRAWRNAQRNADVTQNEDLKRDETQCNAELHQETLEESRGDKIRKEENPEIAAAPQPGADAPSPVVEKGKRKTAKEKAPVPEPVTWFRSVVGRFPPKELFAAVVDVVETRRDEAFLKRCQTEWIARGYNPSNYAWLLDWYGAGIIPATRGGTGRVVATNGVNSHAAHPNGSSPNGAELERRIEAARAKLAEVSGDAA